MDWLVDMWPTLIGFGLGIALFWLGWFWKTHRIHVNDPKLRAQLKMEHANNKTLITENKNLRNQRDHERKEREHWLEMAYGHDILKKAHSKLKKVDKWRKSRMKTMAAEIKRLKKGV